MCIIIISGWKEHVFEKERMTEAVNNDKEMHGKAVKFSRYWKRHCAGHEPPELLLGAGTHRREAPGEIQTR